MAGLTATGLGSGIDISGLVSQLVAAERQPVANRLNLREARTNAELSALGKVKSALSQFRDTLRALQDLPSFQGRKVTVGDDTLLSAKAGAASVPGTWSVEVMTLATGAKLTSAAFPDPDAAIGTGTLSISVGDKTALIAIGPEGNSLRGIRDAINAASDNPGVTATIVNGTAGAQLVLTSRGTGSDQAITVTPDGGDGGLAPFRFSTGAPDNTLTVLQTAADATLKIDDIAVTSAGNTVTDAIEGITLDLVQAKPGTPTSLTVAFDTDGAKRMVQGFVDAWNKLAGTITEVTKYNSETREAAALLGDAAIRGLRDSLRREVTATAGAAGTALSSLATLGITTQTSGKLEVNSTRLDAAVATDFDGLGALFAGDDGLAGRIDGLLEGVLRSSGTLAVREATLKSSLKTITSQRETLERRMERVQSRLEAQFNGMDRLLSQLRNTSNFLTQQLTR